MYESFYGLSAKPFSLLPDADFLYLSERHKRAVNTLEYGVMTQAGFIVITGDVGAGKTTIIRRFVKNSPQDISVGVITNSSASFGRLLGWVAAAFEIPSEGKDDVALNNAFIEYLLAQYAKGKRTVLIIDEAQNLSLGILEELRMLSNVNNEKDQLLQIILVGQPELLETLKRHELRQFVQRISVHCHINSLTPRETAAYIAHRLKIAGGDPNLFDNGACAAVHYFTDGVPRLINLLCDQSLVYGYSEEQTRINFETVVEVVADRNSSGLSSFRQISKSKQTYGMLTWILSEICLNREAERQGISN